MKTITVLYFASVREAVGSASETLQTRAATLGGLRQELAARGGAWAQALAAERPVRIALDQTLARADQALPDGAEVAFFPPVTGG